MSSNIAIFDQKKDFLNSEDPGELWEVEIAKETNFFAKKRGLSPGLG